MDRVFVCDQAGTGSSAFSPAPSVTIRDIQLFQKVRCGGVRKCLWLTLENPGYSIPSKLFSLLSISVVLTSIATMCINSIPENQVSLAICDSSWRLQLDWDKNCMFFACCRCILQEVSVLPMSNMKRGSD